jgi:tetratricopeptide (TPR) repeat protein
MRKLLFSALISALLVGGVKAQDLTKTLVMADSFLRIQNYDAAVQAYDRALFFAPDEIKPRINIGLGRGYYGLGLFDLSSDAYGSAMDVSKLDTGDYDILFEKARSEIWAEAYSRAAKSLSLIDTMRYPQYARRVVFYSGVLHYAERDFDEAEAYFISLVSGNLAKANRMEDLFDELRKSERRQPKTAMLMSFLIPGSGQIYAGNIESGINSILLTGLWLALTVTTAEIYGPFHATVTAFPWLLRYYGGGAENAARLTVDSKKEKREKVFREVLGLVGE